MKLIMQFSVDSFYFLSLQIFSSAFCSQIPVWITAKGQTDAVEFQSNFFVTENTLTDPREHEQHEAAEN
jgi:hypothetical protein